MNPAVITCDALGRIQTFDPAAEALFGHPAADLVGRDRITVLLPGAVVLAQLPGWLEAAARQGAWEGEALCRHRDGRPLPCHLRITPALEGGRPVGFRQEALPLEGVRAEDLAPPDTAGARMARFAAVVRLPFVTATVVPVVAGILAGVAAPGAASVLAPILAVLTAVLLHLGANVANDVFDWRSGADRANRDFVAPFSGGSRALFLGLATEAGLVRLAAALFGLGLAMGVAVVLLSTPAVFLVGLAGILLGVCYTAPPLRLAARRGLGEISIFLAFGPLLSVAGHAAATGSLALAGAWAGVSTGLWTTGILWVNQVPDVPGDRAAGKWNLVATLGRRKGAALLPVLLVGGHVATAVLVAGGLLPSPVLLSLLAVPLAVKASRLARQHAEDDGIAAACAATVQHQLAGGILLLLGLGAGLLL